MNRSVRRRLRPRCDHGATSVEYAILAAGIAAVIVLAVGSLGRSTVALFESLVSAWP